VRRPTRLSVALVVVAGAVVAVAAARSYTIVEVVFFAVPIAFVGFLCWQAAMYHVVRIGDDFAEWDAPLSRQERDGPAERDDQSERP